MSTASETDNVVGKAKTAVSLAVLIIVSTVGEQLFGFTLGYIPVAMQYQHEIANCTAYTTPPACHGVKRAHCVWNQNVSECLFPDLVYCRALGTSAARCAAAGDFCFYQDGVCSHHAGWTPIREGAFAAFVVIGATTGSTFAARLIDGIGRKRSMIAIGLLALVGQAIVTTAWDVDDFGMLIAGRFVIGVAVGLVTCVCPLYVGEMAKEEHKVRLGALFQLNFAVGVALFSAVGLAVDPARLRDKDYHLEARFQILNIPSWYSGLAVLLLGLFMPESHDWLAFHEQEQLAKQRKAEKKRKRKAVVDRITSDGEKQHLIISHMSLATNSASEGGGQLTSAYLKHIQEGSIQPRTQTLEEEEREEEERLLQVQEDAQLGEAVPCAIVARCTVFTLAFAIAVQFTGNSAMLSYAPKITESLGFNPMQGNCAVCFWNFFMTIVGVQSAKRTRRPVKVYAVGTVIASLACLIVGVSKYPGVVENVYVEMALGATGILLFTFAFQALMACFYYMLAQAIFPGRLRSAGTSLALLSQFAAQLLIFFTFPVAVVHISGGPSGDQDYGLSIVFLFFAAVGLTCAVIVWLTKPPWLMLVRGAMDEQQQEASSSSTPQPPPNDGDYGAAAISGGSGDAAVIREAASGGNFVFSPTSGGGFGSPLQHSRPSYFDEADEKHLRESEALGVYLTCGGPSSCVASPHLAGANEFTTVASPTGINSSSVSSSGVYLRHQGQSSGSQQVSSSVGHYGLQQSSGTFGGGPLGGLPHSPTIPVRCHSRHNYNKIEAPSGSLRPSSLSGGGGHLVGSGSGAVGGASFVSQPSPRRFIYQQSPRAGTIQQQ